MPVRDLPNPSANLWTDQMMRWLDPEQARRPLREEPGSKQEKEGDQQQTASPPSNWPRVWPGL